MDALRTAVKPITHNLPTPIRELGISLIGPQCYQSLLLDVDLEDAECLKLAVSKGLGVGIVLAASFVKVPQIFKLVRSRSATGVSLLSLLLETGACLITLAYNFRNNFPFNAYGETVMLALQNILISALVLTYSGRKSLVVVVTAAFAVAAAVLLQERGVDMKTLSYLQASAGVMGAASKVPQVVTIWREGTTGQLSAFAVFNYVAGSLTRIFTTLQEIDDKLILYGFVGGFILNVVLALQMAYYWNAPSAKAKGKRKELPVQGQSTSAAPPKSSPTTRRRG